MPFEFYYNTFDIPLQNYTNNNKKKIKNTKISVIRNNNAQSIDTTCWIRLEKNSIPPIRNRFHFEFS